MTLDVRGRGMTSPRARQRLVDTLRDKGIQNEMVLKLIKHIPRHLFLDEATANLAYDDAAVPIGYRQTISRPYTVARMTEILLGDQETLGNVLEVGTGSGYQTSLLSQIASRVYTVERIQPLQQRARKLLAQLGFHRNITYAYSDGSWGWEQHAPYEGIIVTAAPEEIPESLLEQLAIGGRMIIPVGGKDEQGLWFVQRESETQYRKELLEQASFVPFLDGTVEG